MSGTDLRRSGLLPGLALQWFVLLIQLSELTSLHMYIQRIDLSRCASTLFCIMHEKETAHIYPGITSVKPP